VAALEKDLIAARKDNKDHLATIWQLHQRVAELSAEVTMTKELLAAERETSRRPDTPLTEIVVHVEDDNVTGEFIVDDDDDDDDDADYKDGTKVSRPASPSSKPFQCTYCPNAYARKANLMAHINFHHSDVAPGLPCPSCAQTFRTATLLNYHIRGYHNTPKARDAGHISCVKCHASFTNLYGFNAHGGWHESKKKSEDDGLVGKRVSVYWPSMKQWYIGTVRKHVGGVLYEVHYDDGDTTVDALPPEDRKKTWTFV
jgi:hypothetical protein